MKSEKEKKEILDSKALMQGCKIIDYKAYDIHRKQEIIGFIAWMILSFSMGMVWLWIKVSPLIYKCIFGGL